MFNKCYLLFLIGCSSFMIDASETDLESSRVRILEVDSWLNKSAKSDKDVALEFSHFNRSLEKGVEKGHFTKADVDKILRALYFAAEKHSSQFRKNGKKTPYIIHPIGVANYIISIGGVYETNVIIGALLHDVMDGTGATYEEITAYFGLPVTQYIQEITADPKLSEKETKKQQIIQAPFQSKEVAIIRLADKLHNLKTLMTDPSEGWNQDRLDSYFQWVQAVANHLPLVNDPLKEALDKTIAKYWDQQKKPDLISGH